MAKHNRSPQQVRIIGGKWKGRKLRFHHTNELRPTLGRTRETLFNWIRPQLAGAYCLDAFAGSGALGFEALSQGAGEVLFIESHPRTARTLQDCVHELNAEQQARVMKTDVVRFLKTCSKPFDIVFLDPPFEKKELLGDCLRILRDNHLVKDYVYVEQPRHTVLDDVCAQSGWTIHKQTKAGDTIAALLCS